MASTYSTRLKLELIGSGEQSNSWGNTTNNTLSRSLEEAIAGVLAINLNGVSSPLTLTSGNGPVVAASNQARSAAIRFHNFTAAFTVNFPAVEKIYYIINDGTGNATLTLDVGGTGSGFEIEVTGIETVDGKTMLSGNLTMKEKILSNSVFSG